MILVITLFAFLGFGFLVGLSYFLSGKPVPRSCGGAWRQDCEFCGGEGECKNKVKGSLR